MIKTMKAVIFMASVLLAFGCTRNSSDKANLVLDLGSTKFTSDSSILSSVTVTISGPGISPVISQKFGSNSSGQQPVPAEISLEVPNGKSRLIQFMGVYVNTQTGAKHIIYGDKTQNLSPGLNEVKLVVTPYGASSVEGLITGRYIRSDGSAPTGKIAWKFDPNNGSPPMTIEAFEMFAGYFSVYAFDNVKTSYEFIADGEPIFTNVNINSTVFAASKERVHVSVGSHYNEQFTGNSVFYAPQNSKKIVYGFFGPGSEGKQACWFDSNRPFVGRLFSDSTGASPIAWLGSQGVNSVGVMRPTAGGVANSANSSCLYPDLENYIGLDPQKIAAGIESDLLFSGGPFEEIGINGELVDLTSSESNSVISFQFRPGLFGSQKSISGVEFFYRINTDTNNSRSLNISDSMLCSEFAQFGTFQRIGETALSQTTLTATNLPPNSVENLELLGCPFTDRSWGREFYSLHSAASNFLKTALSDVPMMMFTKISRDVLHDSHEYIRVEWLATNTPSVSYYRLWISENPNNGGSDEADICGNAANVVSVATFFDFDCFNNGNGGNILSSQTPKYFKMQAFDSQNNPLGSQRIQQMLIVPNSGNSFFSRNLSDSNYYVTLDFNANVAGTSGDVMFYKPIAPVGSSGLNCSLISSSGSLEPQPDEYWSPRWISPCVFKSGEGATWSILQFETSFKGIILQDLLRYTTN
jgi:hypothetical protein